MVERDNLLIQLSDYEVLKDSSDRKVSEQRGYTE